MTFSLAVSDALGLGGQTPDKVVITVQEQPSTSTLAHSFKQVNLTSVDNGDILTYTLVIRNSSAITAAAILTDPLPAYTSYVAGSAQASSGSITPPATSQPLYWSGDVISGTPVLVRFAVQVTTTALSVGAPITNVAQLDDGLGNIVLLEAHSTYNPGYGMSINEGALYTRIPTVTLQIGWAEASIATMYVSNDGGFATGSGWIDAANSVSQWRMTTYGNLQMPRIVYAKFRDESDAEYGPLQDDIIYDPVTPTLEIAIVERPANGAMHADGQAATQTFVRATTSDDNSGVDVLVLSDAGDFVSTATVTRTITAPVQEFAWPHSGQVYVKAIDRAGNVSPVQQETVEASGATIYLPLVLRAQ